MKWTHFTENEILNPIFDSCPYKIWNELPKSVQINLEFTMELLVLIRSHINKPIQINSSYRIQERKSAHKYGKAIDFQFYSNNENIYTNTMNYLKTNNITNFRAILEWRGLGYWIHLDRNYKNTKSKTTLIAFPKQDFYKHPSIIQKNMIFQKYTGISPKHAYKINYV